jgi:hypothetical protein
MQFRLPSLFRPQQPDRKPGPRSASAETFLRSSPVYSRGSMCIFSLPLESDQPLFQSAQEVLRFNLYLSGDVGINVVLEHGLPCGAISAASLGLKPRITNPLARAMKRSGSRGRDGLVCSTIMSLKLGRGESVVSLLCFRVAEKRRKRKSPAARGAGTTSKVFIRHPGERSHSNSRPDRVGGLGIPVP